MNAADELRRRLETGARQLGLALEPGQSERLMALIELLARWSRAFNLTAVREPGRMVSYHLLDSLAMAPFLEGERILDVGTGAGFPGLPLAILQPRRRFVLLDGNGKKVRFVRQAVLELGLENVEPVQARIETYQCSAKFATILVRAFAPLADILHLTAPLLLPTGLLLAAKGPRAESEIAALHPAPAVCRVHTLAVPYLEAARALVAIRPGAERTTQ
jgi:16S rRNA (guanine527-N7)-methyltransferase